MEQDKFIAIIRENQNLIYKVCYSYCSDEECRKDLQQEVLIQLWKSFSKFDGRVKISTWIYRIALNTAISFYRKDRKHQDKKVRLDDAIISLPEPSPNAEKDENLILLRTFISQLGEVDKALILLYLEDAPYAEISDILGISESNVSTKIGRIRRKLKKQFTKQA